VWSLVELGKNFDWISPIVAMVGNVVRGPSATFIIPQDCGLTGREITCYLNRRGIQTWGLMAISDVFVFSVREADEQRAGELLGEMGI